MACPWEPVGEKKKTKKKREKENLAFLACIGPERATFFHGTGRTLACLLAYASVVLCSPVCVPVLGGMMLVGRVQGGEGVGLTMGDGGFSLQLVPIGNPDVPPFSFVSDRTGLALSMDGWMDGWMGRYCR